MTLAAFGFYCSSVAKWISSNCSTASIPITRLHVPIKYVVYSFAMFVKLIFLFLNLVLYEMICKLHQNLGAQIWKPFNRFPRHFTLDFEKTLFGGNCLPYPGVTVALNPLRFTKKSRFQANEPRYMVCGDVNLITSSECYWCQIISLSAWGLPDRAPLIYVCCWWNLICCHLCWWGQFPWADPDAVFCRRDEDEKKTSTASGFFQQIWAV